VKISPPELQNSLVIKPSWILLLVYAKHNFSTYNKNDSTSFRMKFAALLCTFIASVAVTASVVPEIQARDTCGPGFGGDQRRTNSFCNASNGRKIFCGCDRTDLVS
tara:strand:+ start:39570 stop:39887 length:318 start_codon:yes stop_codon:yes gene_type:complete